MKDEIEDKIKECKEYDEVKSIVDDWIDYYNNDRCVWKLNKLPPHKFYESIKNNPFSINETKKI